MFVPPLTPSGIGFATAKIQHFSNIYKFFGKLFVFFRTTEQKIVFISKENGRKSTFLKKKCKNIWSCQKKAVLLHPLLRNKRV
jgi:hypothetical protein